jgi:hypothetical protein
MIGKATGALVSKEAPPVNVRTTPMLKISSATKAPVSPSARLRHQRRLRSAVAVFCDAVEANTWGTRGPCSVMLWEAGVLGLDANALDALIDERAHLQTSDVINHMPLPIAA